LTDEELFMLANDLLIENNQENDVIWYATFKDYKNQDRQSDAYTTYKDFSAIYRKAIVKQRQSLFTKLEWDQTWQRYAWIIERKFSDWNLRQITDNNNKNTNVNINKEMKDMTEEELLKIANS
jgi:hypothetical protein